MSDRTCASVLVVEDEKDIREVIAEYLSDRGFEVHQAANGKEALEVLERAPHPMVIVADLMMPVMDGRALMAALRQDDRLATLPVVILTASPETAGVAGYRLLKKPVDLDDIVKIVNELCDKKHP